MSIAHYKKLEKAFLDNIPNYPDTFYGRGIVTACGSKECYHVGAYVLINMLRFLGCQLPVEVWKFDWEKDNKWDDIFNNLDNVIIKYYDKKISDVDRKGWSLKPFSILESSFKEVLFLDSDICPTKDPTYLFDYDLYKNQGSIFWSDVSKTHVKTKPNQYNKSKDAFWHLAECDEIDEREFESGQLLINKQQCWKELNLTCHYNKHANWYYTLFLGDKETFHLAWRRLGKDFIFLQNTKHIDINNSKYFYQYDWNNELVFQHRCANKFTLTNNIFEPKFEYQDKIIDIIQELRTKMVLCH